MAPTTHIQRTMQCTQYKRVFMYGRRFRNHHYGCLGQKTLTQLKNLRSHFSFIHFKGKMNNSFFAMVSRQ